MELLFEKYGVEGETKEANTDDKIQVAGIVFKEFPEYIPDILGTTTGSKIRAELDAAAVVKLAGFHTMFIKFINKEVIIMLPEKWTSEETKWSIHGLSHEGVYEQYRTFDPHNAAQIALNFNGFLGKVVLEYQECIKRYKMGTGG